MPRTFLFVVWQNWFPTKARNNRNNNRYVRYLFAAIKFKYYASVGWSTRPLVRITQTRRTCAYDGAPVVYCNGSDTFIVMYVFLYRRVSTRRVFHESYERSSSIYFYDFRFCVLYFRTVRRTSLNVLFVTFPSV